MVKVKKYHLAPTRVIPNNPNPLLHYEGLFASTTGETTTTLPLNPAEIHDRFAANSWQTQWIFRYAPSQAAHYHSATHECMVVLSGSATIRFGVADGEADDGGIEVQANAGDCFVIPAGVAHKTFDTLPRAEFKLLTPGDGHGIDAVDARSALEEIRLDGFTMIGAYPLGEGRWDFITGKEEDGDAVVEFEKVWAVRKPERDPVLGDASDGLCGLWK